MGYGKIVLIFLYFVTRDIDGYNSCKCGGLLSPAFRIDKDMVQKVKHIAPSSVSPSSVASTASVEHHEHQQSSPANQRGKNVKGFFE